MTQPIDGVILAGGASTRMGRPKALLRLEGQSFVARLVGLFLRAGCREVVVVGGAHGALIEAAVPAGALYTYAEDWARGMRASLRAGVAALQALHPEAPADVLLTHVDRPLVLPETLQVLMDAPRGRPISPVFEGRGGHPVVLPKGLLPRLLKPDDQPLRDLLLNPRQVVVQDPGVLLNVNTPEAYARLLAQVNSE